MATDLTARGLALRGIADAAAATDAAENLVRIQSTTGSGANRTLAGNAPPNTQVTIFDNGAAIGSTPSDASGAWTFRATGLSDGSHSFTARAPVGSAALAAAISDTTPLAAGFAELPRRGFRVLSDAISLLQWGLDYGTHENGDGAAALAANPDSNSNRDQVLRFSTAGGAGSAFVAEKLRFLAHGGNRTTSSASDTTLAAGYWVMTLSPVSGAGQVFAAYSSATQRGEQFRVGYAASGSGFKFTVNGAAVGREIAWSKMVRARLSWAANGALVLQSNVAGEGSYTSEYSAAPSTIAAIQTLRWGLWNCAGASDVRFADVAISDTSFADVDRDWTLVGSGTRDVGQTEAAVALVIPDGMFTGMDKARLRWAAGLDPSAGTAESWVALSGKVRSVLALALSGLTANTVYSWQIEIADAGGTVLHTSEAYRLRTLAAAGTASAAELNFTSCYGQTPNCHPYTDDQYTLDTITASYVGTVNLGDLGYEAGLFATSSPYIDEHPPESEAQLEQMLRELCADPVLHGLFLAGMYMATPDDHETVNQIDASAASGGANENTPVRFFRYAQSADEYDPGTTLGDLWTNGLAVFDAWFAGHWLDTPSPGVYYQKKVLGNVEMILLDTRYERLPASSLYMSSTQLTWAQNAIAAVAGTTELVIIASQTAFASYTAKDQEGWQAYAASQFATFIDYVIANCSCNFLFVSGDDHAGYALHRKITTATNPVTPAKCLGELRASGGSTSLVEGVEFDRSDWFYNRGALNEATAFLRSSGVLCALSASGESATLSARIGGVTSSYSVGTVAPVSTRKARLVVDNTYIGANNSAGTVDEAILIARADLPNEICDPSSGNKAAFANGRDIRAKTTGGASLAIEVVNFEYDSATGAGDANIEIWVRHTWDKAAATEFDLFWGDSSALSTMPNGQACWPSDALAVWHCKTVRDSTGRGRDLTLDNASFIDGPAGSALYFDGVDAKATAAFNPASGTAARTEVMLFRARPTNGSAACFYAYGKQVTSSTAGDRWALSIPTATVNKLQIAIGGGSQTATTTNVTDNDWHALVVQLPSGTNSSNIDMFVDGVEETYTNVSKTIATGTDTLSVGAVANTNFANFDLAELRFYSGALSADRVATIGKTLSAIGSYIATGAPGAA